MSDERIPRYRTAFIVMNSGHNFRALQEHCERIEFIATGYEDRKDIPRLKDKLKEFDPFMDVIVPVGGAASNFLIGMLFGSMNFEEITVAQFTEGAYTFAKIGGI